MLYVDPKMIPRLTEIETDLIKRRERAEGEGWQGEIEGIDLTLTYLRAKRDQVRRQIRHSVDIGLPRFKGGNDE